MAPKEPIIGVDLGTTNSCAAIVDGARTNGVPHVKLIPYKGRASTTVPSIFAIDDQGQRAHRLRGQAPVAAQPQEHHLRRQAPRRPQLSAATIVDTMKKVVGYQLRPSADKQRGRPRPSRRKSSRCRKSARRFSTRFETFASNHPAHAGAPRRRERCPPTFTDRQRQSVKRQRQAHQTWKSCAIINEPTAAALAYGVGQRPEREGRESTTTSAAARSTFPSSRFAGRVFEVKSTGGDIFLGGIDFRQTR